jgi:hypothetical protein
LNQRIDEQALFKDIDLVYVHEVIIGLHYVVVLLQQKVVDEGLFHFVPQEGLHDVLKELLVFLEQIEVELVARIFVVHFQFFLLTKLGPFKHEQLIQLLIDPRWHGVVGLLNLFHYRAHLLHIVNDLYLSGGDVRDQVLF